MGRVFICGFYNFPRGGAASNYVQYMAQMFLAMGKEVVAITEVNHENGFDRDDYLGIKIEPIEIKSDTIGHYLDYNFRLGGYFTKALKKYTPNARDIVIAYSRDPFILKAVLGIGKQCGAKTGVCLVEWFERMDFDRWYLNLRYWGSAYSFHFLNEKFDFILPISTYIEDFYKKKGCKTFRLPCLADTEEYGFCEKNVEGKIIIIFPGNGKLKDALNQMIGALSLLTEEERAKIEFHICGIGRLAREAVHEAGMEEHLGKDIIVHDWMPYGDLVSLYRKAHFLLLARDVSRMTLANFPSKIPETLTYGIIPLCSRVGDYTKIYLRDGENSLILDGCDENTIAAGIRRALRMEDKEISECSARCRKTAEEQFDFRRWIEPVKDYLSNCVYTEE